MRGAAASGILAVRKRAAPRNRMREILTSGSVGGLAEQSLVLPGRIYEVPEVRHSLSRWRKPPVVRETGNLGPEGRHMRSVSALPAYGARTICNRRFTPPAKAVTALRA